MTSRLTLIPITYEINISNLEHIHSLINNCLYGYLSDPGFHDSYLLEIYISLFNGMAHSIRKIKDPIVTPHSDDEHKELMAKLRNFAFEIGLNLTAIEAPVMQCCHVCGAAIVKHRCTRCPQGLVTDSAFKEPKATRNNNDSARNFRTRLEAYYGNTKGFVISDEAVMQLRGIMSEMGYDCNAIAAHLEATQPSDNEPYTLGPLFIAIKKWGALYNSRSSESSSSKFNRNIEVVANRVMGWRLRPFNETEINEIMRHYNMTEVSWRHSEARSPTEDKKSSINVNLRLYLHLRLANIPARLNNFKAPHDPDALRKHKHTFRAACVKCGFPEDAIQRIDSD